MVLSTESKQSRNEIHMNKVMNRGVITGDKNTMLTLQTSWADYRHQHGLLLHAQLFFTESIYALRNILLCLYRCTVFITNLTQMTTHWSTGKIYFPWLSITVLLWFFNHHFQWKADYKASLCFGAILQVWSKCSNKK